MSSSSLASIRRRPCDLRLDGDWEQCTAAVSSVSAVDRLLADIAFQRQREQRQRVEGRSRRRAQRCCEAEGHQMTNKSMVSELDTDDDDGEAASAYWWTDVFLRYFVFDEDYTKSRTTVADSDDLLFFVRRRRRGKNKRKKRQVAYDTRAYRKQQHHHTLLPIGDPAIMWRQTVCLNTIVHCLRYTLTVAVCARVPRKSTMPVVSGIEYYENENGEDIDDGLLNFSQEYDLQMVSRHVHTVYASTSGRRMDADKGPKERSVYPSVCWAVDDYADAFRTVIVRPGQTVCTELVATWSSSTVVEKFTDDGDDEDSEQSDNDNKKCTPIKIQQKQNRAVLFSGAVPYAAVRATYECKMSLYREAERQRRRQQKRCSGKKSSLSSALSASLTALFSGGKEAAADYNDYDCVYEAISATDSERIEYVTVRGCCLRRDVDDGQLSEDQNNYEFDDACSNNNVYENTKGLAQMAVRLAPVQTTKTSSTLHGYNSVDVGQDCDYGDAGYDCDSDFDGSKTDAEDFNRGYQPRPHQQQFIPPPSSYTTSEPGDFYDYGWDYETATASEQQTPQSPSYHYQQQQQLQFDWQRRRGGRPRRLSDPCSKSAYDLLDDDESHFPLTPNQQPTYAANNRCKRNTRRRNTASYRNYNNDDRHECRWRPSNSGGGSSTASTPGTLRNVQHPHRAWSESDGLDRCGGGWPYGGAGVLSQQQQRKRKMPLPPPPVPYYCAAEVATSGFVQFLHKSPGRWRSKMRIRRRMKKSSGKASKKGRLRDDKSADSSRRRSTSAGVDRHTDGRDGSNSDDGFSSSDSDQMADSDGEFIGALAAAAAEGHDPDREWMRHGSDGDPTADWDRYDSSDSDSVVVELDDENTLEWTAEIVATDLRHGPPASHVDYTGYSLPSRKSSIPQDDFNYCLNKQATPVTANQSQTVQKPFGHVVRQQQRSRRHPMPQQLRPRPLELPPLPPALSVAITAVACPWWTVLDDVLLVSAATNVGLSSTRKTAVGLPLLTFD